VHEVILVDPSQLVLFARVIKAILRAFDSVDVEEDFDAMRGEAVHRPFNLVSSTIHAASVWTIGLKSPVTDWNANKLNATICELLEMLLFEPLVPMGAHHLVRSITKCLAERPAVHTDAIGVVLSKEAIE